MYPHVEFCVSSGYRLNFALRARNQRCRKPDGSWLNFPRKTLVTTAKVPAFFYAMERANCMQGLHTATPLSVLTFCGKQATCNDCGILLDDLVQVSRQPALDESLLPLRTP